MRGATKCQCSCHNAGEECGVQCCWQGRTIEVALDEYPRREEQNKTPYNDCCGLQQGCEGCPEANE